MSLSSIILSLICLCTAPDPMSLDQVRAGYTQAVSDKEMCKEMIKELSKLKSQSATHLAYLGGLQTIWANHVFSPISKLRTFKEGKGNIEQALKLEPDNPELRFIRLSVQKNAPSFLGYSANIKEDVKFIMENSHRIHAETLRDNIHRLLKD